MAKAEVEKRSACFAGESTRSRPLFYVAFTPPMRYRDDIACMPTPPYHDISLNWNTVMCVAF